MNIQTTFVLTAALGAVQQLAIAGEGATAPYNEAVRLVGGRRVVDVAPFPPRLQYAVNHFKRPEDYPVERSVNSIETPDGLMDCVGTLWFHPKACSRSTFGKQVRDRTWIVEMNRQWFTCATYTSVKSCVPLVVDGNLHPLPYSRE